MRGFFTSLSAFSQWEFVRRKERTEFLDTVHRVISAWGRSYGTPLSDVITMNSHTREASADQSICIYIYMFLFLFSSLPLSLISRQKYTTGYRYYPLAFLSSYFLALSFLLKPFCQSIDPQYLESYGTARSLNWFHCIVILHFRSREPEALDLLCITFYLSTSLIACSFLYCIVYCTEPMMC